MLIFVDESGDCGMTSQDSSPRFTLAAVLFETIAAAEACDVAIHSLRKTLAWADRLEFHFNANSDPVRRAFLEAVALHDFLYVTFTLDKRRLSGEQWRNKIYFYQEAARRLVDPLGDLLQIAHGCTGMRARALIDDNQDPVYIRAMQEQLRRPKDDGGKSLVKKARAQASKTSNLLQLADMVCGSVAYRQSAGSGEFATIIQKREGKVITWP